ncbi:MAG: hypothetical protein JXJ04_03595 [Spirochaetales bacterium]|nr:hypothetical protein [Spirochaetales bacterium]
MSIKSKTATLTDNLSRVLKQLVNEGIMIYAYHWDPPHLDLYLGDEQPYCLEVTQGMMEQQEDSHYLKEWIKNRMQGVLHS